MLTDIKLSKAQLSKMTQLGEFLHGMLGGLGNIGKRATTDLAISLVRDNFTGLIINLASKRTSNVKDKLGREISGKGAVWAGKRFTLFIPNEDLNDIIKIIKHWKSWMY